MILGKFLPPHTGHVYLVEFARRYCDELTVVVGSLASEPIPGELRHCWMREMFPEVSVIHLTDENPQDPSEHPAFWDIWRESLVRVLPRRPDFIFGSERYGHRLAAELGARFVMVDATREAFPVSGTAVRVDPLAHWRYLPRCVRPHFVRRVSVFGPESTGKTTLARRIAAHYGTVSVPEHARTHLEEQDGRIGPDDIEPIARGQLAAEDALARDAERLLVCDTDVLATVIWSEVLFGDCPTWIRDEATRRRYDITLLLDVDVPGVADPIRYRLDERSSFFDRCARALDAHGRRWVRIGGAWDERFATARLAVDEALRPR
jgi:HTH-type transcriptional regulator, transcriptional repressor of NAD biosynthesis genes